MGRGRENCHLGVLKGQNILKPQEGISKGYHFLWEVCKRGTFSIKNGT